MDFVLIPDSEVGRYKLHDLARLFAESCLEQDELADVQQKHAKYYSKVLSQANMLYEKGEINLLAGLNLFDREWANIRVGQAWVKNTIRSSRRLKKSDLKFVLQLARSYAGEGVFVLDVRLHPRDKIGWLETGLTAARTLRDPQAEGTHLCNMGLAYADLGETRKAIEYHEQALVISREIGDRRGEGANLVNLGNAYLALGETRKAIKYHDQALAISREIGDRNGEGADLGNLGNAYLALGEVRRAIEYYEQALAVSREIGDPSMEGENLLNFGKAYAALGETTKAIGFYEQSLEIVRKIEDRKSESEALCNLGKAFALGEVGKSIVYYEQSLEIARKIEYRRVEGDALFNMSLALDKLGQRQEAIDRAKAALSIFEQIESPDAEKTRQKLAEWQG